MAKPKITNVKYVGAGVEVLVFTGQCQAPECAEPTLGTRTIKDGEVVKEFLPRFCRKHDITKRFGS